MRRFLLALAVTVAALGLRGPGAQVREFDSGLKVRCDRPWPSGLTKGFFPVWVELENPGSRPRQVELTLEFSWGSEHRVTQTVGVPGGSTITVEMFAPAGQVQWGSYSLWAHPVGERRQHVSGAGNFDRTHAPQLQHAVLVLTDEAIPEAGIATWNASLSGHQVMEGTREVGNARTVAYPAPDGPRNFEAYTSLDLVVVDTRSRDLSERSLGPLLRWVRGGGMVAFEGPGARGVAKSLESVAPWLEDRFELPLPAAGDADLSRGFLMGLGAVLVTDTEGELLTRGPVLELYKVLLEERPGTVPRSDGLVRSYSNCPQIPGLEDLPYRFFVVALILFAIIVGPVNFMAVKRLGRPVLLLLTIPLLAGGASVLILAYGTLYQGIDVKSASASLMLLDQRTHRATTLEHRAFFAGLSAGRSLRFEAGTTLFPEEGSRSLRGLRVNLGAQAEYLGDYLPVRREARQTILGERVLRGRVVFGAQDEGTVATNGLEWPLEGLTYRDAGGAYHAYAGVLEPGETATLLPTDGLPIEAESLLDQTDQRVFGGGIETVLPETFKQLLPGSYVATIRGASGGDQGGLESNELEGLHALIGVVAGEEAR